MAKVGLKVLCGMIGVVMLIQCATLRIPVEGAGAITDSPRTVAPFAELKVSGNVDLVLSPDSLFSVSVTAHENLLPHIRTQVEHDQLLVSTTVPIRSQVPVRIAISLPALSRLEVSRSGNISATSQLSAENFTAVIRESGTVALDISAKTVHLFLTDTEIVRIKGTAHTIEATLNGRSVLDSRALEAKVGRVNLYGPSQSSIYASKVLFAQVDGPGVVTYYGQPEELNRQIRGPGQIKAGAVSPLN